MTNEYSADLVPILAAIADRAARLCESRDARIFVVEGNALRYVAGFGEVPFPTEPVRPLIRGLITGRAILDRAVVHVEDMAAAAKEFPEGQEYQRRYGHRTSLAVPLARGDNVLGVILLRRSEVRPFDTKHIELVKAFADQAAVAIENIRLSTELNARNAELTEALEQQTATAEILKVISSSPTDTQPVFDAIVKSGARLFAGKSVSLRLAKGDFSELVASTDAATRHRISLSDEGSVTNRALTRGEVVQVADIFAEEWVGEISRQRAMERGFRSFLSAPLMREGKAIGVVSVVRAVAGPFSDKEVALLKTFADQAVIAIENVRLFNETKEALERQTATSELLKVIGQATSDLQPVFDTLAENAVKVCRASQAFIFRFDMQFLRVVASCNVSPELRRFFADNPIAPGRGTVAGRAAAEGRTIHVHDVRAEPEYGWTPHRVDPIRTVLTVPMIRGGEVLGVIGVNRPEVRPFSEHEIELLQSFASQAVIAIENVRLFKELQARNTEVTEALEQQTATAEILKVISASPSDVLPVFQAIARHAVALCGSLFANVFRFDGELLHYVASHNTGPDYVELLQSKYPMRPDKSQISGRVLLGKSVVRLEDARSDPDYDQRFPVAMGWRRMLGVPMLRDGKPLGSIVVGWAEAGPVLRSTEELLKTFAEQAVIAIENVRLFDETKEALEQQTATADILKVISSSPTDVQPVFDAIVKSGVRLFDGLDVGLRLVKGDQVELVASTRAPGTVGELQPLDANYIASHRSILRREVVHIPDVFAEDAEEWIREEYRERAERRGFRGILCAPMLREGSVVGAIVVTRAKPGPFTDKQIALLKTFADQAVIAIENVRLFKEIQERNAELREALEHQTATSEVLGIISRSPTEVQPVLDAIVESAARVCRIDDVLLRLREGNKFVMRAHFGPIPVLRYETDVDRPSYRWLREHGTLHIPDAREQTDFHFPMADFAGGWLT
ncbi:MAG TPA: GAF domain-containing protein, partial [Burkholderiales bacterium]|nr:GAF domain-containing protein [Burkholderiales bacterium]